MNVSNACRGRLDQNQRADEVRPIERKLQRDLTARRVSDPARTIEAQMLGQQGQVPCMITDRQMARGLASSISGPSHPHDPKGVEGRVLAHEREPVGKDACVYQDNRRSRATRGVRDLCVVDR
jgi:hypothetical protein